MKDWVWNIFIITTSLAFIEILLPESGIQKYLKFVFSIFILAVIIFPFGDRAIGEINTSLNMAVKEEAKFAGEGYEMLEKILSTQTRQINDVYKERARAFEQNSKRDENPGISLPWTDIYSNDEEEQN